ncbi:MAG TPA: [Fe-S]-binding protein, partial [Candidatus Angelobacter sp.]|nr:[Fe-S]-binding protein [Candidatus Angelobacter sp.]
CGACTSVCPVKIDLHHHLLHNRRDFVRNGHSAAREKSKFHWFSRTMSSPRFYAFAGGLMRRSLRALYALGLAGSALDPMRAWTKHRAPVPLPKKSFREQWRSGLGDSK